MSERDARTFDVMGLEDGCLLALRRATLWRIAGFTLGGPSGERTDAGLVRTGGFVELKIPCRELAQRRMTRPVWRPSATWRGAVLTPANNERSDNG